jgi:phosphatidylinositol-3,4,5-trisphosphate 3-phosphatase/dual-specificity protein phosphatase PTEN
MSTARQAKKSFTLRGVVSGGRNRYIDDQYDLDLSYITPNIIAMSIPAAGLESTYRNHIDQVAQFINSRHKSRYMIINATTEKKYEYDKFDNNVLELGWFDHHAPYLELLFQACQAMSSWLAADEKNVVVVHCKAGKGRTGTLISCFLLYSGLSNTAQSALQHFEQQRSSEVRGGVTIPSQIRYVQYFNNILAGYRPHTFSLKLKQIVFHGSCPLFAGSALKPQVKIYSVVKAQHNELYNEKHSKSVKMNPGTCSYSWTLAQSIPLYKDILIKIKHQGLINNTKFCRIQFHSGFIAIEKLQLYCPKNQLDDACKDKKLEENFGMTLIFALGEVNPAGGMELWDQINEIRQLNLNKLKNLSLHTGTSSYNTEREQIDLALKLATIANQLPRNNLPNPTHQTTSNQHNKSISFLNAAFTIEKAAKLIGAEDLQPEDGSNVAVPQSHSLNCSGEAVLSCGSDTTEIRNNIIEQIVEESDNVSGPLLSDRRRETNNFIPAVKAELNNMVSDLDSQSLAQFQQILQANSNTSSSDTNKDPVEGVKLLIAMNRALIEQAEQDKDVISIGRLYLEGKQLEAQLQLLQQHLAQQSNESSNSNNANPQQLSAEEEKLFFSPDFRPATSSADRTNNTKLNFSSLHQLHGEYNHYQTLFSLDNQTATKQNINNELHGEVVPEQQQQQLLSAQSSSHFL